MSNIVIDENLEKLRELILQAPKSKGGRRKFSDEIRGCVLDLHRHGLSGGKISCEVGLPPVMIERWLRPSRRPTTSAKAHVISVTDERRGPSPVTGCRTVRMNWGELTLEFIG